MDRRAFILAGLAPAILAGSCQARGATVVRVSTSDELVAALKRANGGETIRLAPGVYPGFSVSNLKFAQPVTVMGEDAVVQGKTTIYGCSNLTLDGLFFRGDPDRDSDCLLLRESNRLTVRGCEFQGAMCGIGHLNNTDLRIERNRFVDLRSDGMRGGGSSRVAIIDNHFSSFHPRMRADGRGDHPDAIQFWTSNTKAAAEDILIQRNVIERGSGSTVQGIFVGDESGGKLPYLRVRILDNVVIGGAWNGVAIGSGSDIEIARNVCLAFPDEGCRIRVQNVMSGVVSDNQASDFVFMNNGRVTLSRNKKLGAVNDGGAAFMRAREKQLGQRS